MKLVAHIVVSVALICCVASAWAAPGKKLAGGLWGGPDLRMEVTDSGATLEFGCGSATITEPIALDPNGNFQVTGSYTQGEFGPTREGASSGREASFSGTVERDTLKLEMVLSGEDRVRKFTVTRGRSAKLVKCK